ncbi:MAG: TerC family protein [Bacteroidia bacterium]
MFEFSVFATPEAWISLATLTLLEIVLGIDNIVFISIIAAKLPKEQQDLARKVGLILALAGRLVMLGAIAWLIGLEKSLFTVFERDISIRDLILILGGLFLMAKSVTEIHAKLQGSEGDHTVNVKAKLSNVLIQIILLDLVFSLDSILTAIGLVEELVIMGVAIMIAIMVMLVFARAISDFVNKHPTIKMLALSFLLMIGMLLVVEAFEVHVPKGYVYFAMAFSLFVELLNLRLRKPEKK